MSLLGEQQTTDKQPLKEQEEEQPIRVPLVDVGKRGVIKLDW